MATLPFKGPIDIDYWKVADELNQDEDENEDLFLLDCNLTGAVIDFPPPENEWESYYEERKFCRICADMPIIKWATMGFW